MTIMLEMSVTLVLQWNSVLQIDSRADMVSNHNYKFVRIHTTILWHHLQPYQPHASGLYKVKSYFITNVF